MKKILVIKFFGIGSLVLATPLLRRIHEVFPNAEVHFLTLSSNREIVGMIEGIDEPVFVDLGRNTVTAILAFMGCLSAVFRRRYEVVIDLEFFTQASAVVSFASFSPIRVGFHSRGVYRGGIQTHRVPFNPYWHVTRNFLNALEPFDPALPPAAPKPHLVVDREPTPPVRDLLDELGDNAERYIVINVNAGALVYERRWMPERFAELAARLSKSYGVTCVFVGAPTEVDYTTRIAEAATGEGADVVNAAGRLDLNGLAQIFARSLMIVTNDSGPLHIASAIGCPVAGLFGPETPVLYGPMSKNSVALFSGRGCSPCINVEHGKRFHCWHPSRLCLEDISVDQAFASIESSFGASLASGDDRMKSVNSDAAVSKITNASGSNTTV